MSTLVVLGFDGIHAADEVLNKVRSLQKRYLIDLEDACVVEREKAGKIHIKQAVNLTALGAASGGSWGAMWGTLVGLLFLNPLAGMAIGALGGASAGALSGSLVDHGIDDNFIKKLGQTIPEGSSALFVLGEERDGRQGVARARTLQASNPHDVAFDREGKSIDGGLKEDRLAPTGGRSRYASACQRQRSLGFELRVLLQ